MSQLQIVSSAGQVAAHLRGELLAGKLRGLMPGVLRLEAELGVNRKTIEAAMRELEREGLLVGQGPGRRRRIAAQTGKSAKPLRVAILLSEAEDLKVDYLVELRHELAEAGHAVFSPPGYMLDLGMEVGRVARLVRRSEADAWVVVAGSREVLAWFVDQGMTAFALFGRRRGLPMAAVGPDKPPAVAVATRALIGLGHQRIVLLVRPRRRLPRPGASEQAFLDELSACGLAVGDYHLPGWEETVPGFHACLEALFQFTPPTALIVDEVPLFVATLQFLARRGLRVPEDVSLVCTDASPDFAWCQPSVAHIHWDSRPVVRRVVRWADNVGRGRHDLRQTLTPAVFVPGGTITAVGQ